MTALLVAAAISVLPSDRLAMADRQFNKGNYEVAVKEYRALVGEPSIATDELTYRLAECDRAVGKTDEAMKEYHDLFTLYPDSKYADKSRFCYAVGLKKPAERRAAFAALDSDRVEVEVRSAALYHLGSETSNAEALAKCVKLSPKGKYADYANLRQAQLLCASKDAVERRRGVELLLGIAFGKSPIADEALYLAALQSYREKKYGEASSLFRRYRKLFPKGANVADSRTMSAWCDFLQGRYSDAAAMCGNGETDDFAYIRAACAYSTGDNEKALKLFKQYLVDYPEGNYRKDAELPIARIEFDAAQKAGSSSDTIESARRSFSLSKLASDQLRLAWAYEKSGKQDEAASEYAEVIRNYEGSEEAAEAMFRKAMIDIRLENWSAAELTLSEAVATGKLGRRKAEALYWSGVAAMRIDHETEGVERLQAAVKAGLSLDESREARLMVADVDFRAGRTEAAKAAYERLVREGACERMSAARILAVGKLLGGADGETCAKALVKGEAAEWRQAGWALKGSCEEQRSAFTQAIESYRKCLAEPTRTEEAAYAALHLGRLETRAGEFDKAEVTLKSAVALNTSSAKARGEAYLALAENAERKGDGKSAVAYATVVTSLFDDETVVAAAKKILDSHPEESK